MSIGQSVQWGDLLKGTNVKLNRNGTVISWKAALINSTMNMIAT